MNLELSKIIQKIEAQISPEYLSGCMAWADKTHNNKWSNAIDEFEKQLNKFRETLDHGVLNNHARVYQATCIELIQEYKKIKGLDDADEFLKSIE